jgi:hypothetical protein
MAVADNARKKRVFKAVVNAQWCYDGHRVRRLAAVRVSRV